MMDMIGFDSEYQSTRMRSHKAITGSPDNKREMPCDTCPHSNSCAEKSTECSAFRVWAKYGDYEDVKVGKHIRALKGGMQLTKANF